MPDLAAPLAPPPQSLPVSANQPIHFTPADLCDDTGAPLPGAPIYHLRVGRGTDRALYRKTVEDMGGAHIELWRVRETIRDAVRASAPENMAEILAALDRDMVRSQNTDAAAVLAEFLTPEGQADRKLIDHVREFLRPHYQPLATLLAAQNYWNELAPYAAMRVFLIGWDLAPVPADMPPEQRPAFKLPAFRQVMGRVPLELIRELPEAHVILGGWYVLNAMELTKDQEKNLLSPLRSPATPAASVNPSSPLTGRPGNSSAKSTRKIRASA